MESTISAGQLLGVGMEMPDSGGLSQLLSMPGIAVDCCWFPEPRSLSRSRPALVNTFEDSVEPATFSSHTVSKLLCICATGCAD